MHTSIPTLVGFRKTPWNKGRLIGQKRPLKPKEAWTIRVRLQLERRRRDLAYSISPSTASYAAAISWGCVSQTFVLAATSGTVPL